MDSFALEDRCRRKGLSNSDVADFLGIDKSTYFRKRKGYSEFTRNEIQDLKALLDLTSDDVDMIFFRE